MSCIEENHLTGLETRAIMSMSRKVNHLNHHDWVRLSVV